MAPRVFSLTRPENRHTILGTFLFCTPRCEALDKTTYESGLPERHKVSVGWLDEFEFFEDQRSTTRRDILYAEVRSPRKVYIFDLSQNHKLYRL